MVLTSQDVNETSGLRNVRLSHAHATIAGTDIKYAFIGNGARVYHQLRLDQHHY